MEQRKITSIVVAENGEPARVAGVLHLHDLWRDGDVLRGVAAVDEIHSVTTEQRAAKIKLVLFDVDGVLTDGKILLHADGTESKKFDIKDGTGDRLGAAARADRGVPVGADSSAATAQRAAQLGITLVHQGVASKLDTYDQIVDGLLLEDEQVAYMGDDVLDLPVLSRVGLAAAPADAAEECARASTG